MRKDQIFVLLLVILMPLSGCFSGVGEVEGEGNSGSQDDVFVLYVPSNSVGTIQITDGQFVEVLDTWSDENGENPGAQVIDYRGVSGEFNCTSHQERQNMNGVGAYSNFEFGTDWLPTDGTECTYYFDRTGLSYYDESPKRFGDLYIIYRIH